MGKVQNRNAALQNIIYQNSQPYKMRAGTEYMIRKSTTDRKGPTSFIISCTHLP